MAALSQSQVYALARTAGLSPAAAVTATAVAQAESGLVPDREGDLNLVGQPASNGQHWGPSVGLWQIRSIQEEYGTGQTRDAAKLTDPAFNAQSMAHISGAGKSFGAWTTFTQGTYKQFVGADQKVAQAAGDDPNSRNVGGIGGALQSTMGELYSALVPGGSLAVNQLGGNEIAGAAGQQVNNAVASWYNDALKLGLYILSAGLGAALLYAGAKGTVSRVDD